MSWATRDMEKRFEEADKKIAGDERKVLLEVFREYFEGFDRRLERLERLFSFRGEVLDTGRRHAELQSNLDILEKKQAELRKYADEMDDNPERTK